MTNTLKALLDDLSITPIRYAEIWKEIDNMLDVTYKAGVEQGDNNFFQDGWDEGHGQGLLEGYDRGYDDGIYHGS